mmetsp:Transcript_19006/g.51663  ORF Transcript_19006/g.51663 Transcript_19006/m.51663 type:complete len:267 (-) Transcript_19006:50-850(-)
MAEDENNPIIQAYGPRSTKTSDTLYNRMGGEAKLETIVDGVYKLMRDDKVIGKEFARFRLERLKDRTVDYLRGEFGGPEYNGSDLWISHSHLAVKNDWYDIMMKYYVKMLKRAKMPQAETEEILKSLEKMRKPIVDPGQKLKDIYLRYCEKEDAKVGGNGWTVDPKKWREGSSSKPPESLPPPGEAGASQLPGAVSSPASKAEPKRAGSAKRRARKPAADPTRQFEFTPALDDPPKQLPSSAPSGAELLYRLSNRPMSSPGLMLAR